ncbi:MAG: hypothetical protein AB7R69_02245 [Candidatus Babeliales bacterium]
MKKRLIKLVTFFIILLNSSTLFGLSTRAKNDPFPIFSADWPTYIWLLDKTLLNFKECGDLYTKSCIKPKVCTPCSSRVERDSHCSLAFSGFYQKANCGRNYDREKVALGDLEGRWHMLGMCYGPVPNAVPGLTGAPVFPTTLENKQLGIAKEALFPPITADEIVPADRILTDSSREVGFFSVPTHYRKHGVRFEFAFQPHVDFGILVQGSYADIKNTATQFINLTPFCGCQTDCNGLPVDYLVSAPQFTCNEVNLINAYLMSSTSANKIFREQGIETRSNTQNRCDFRVSGFEDLRFFVWFRHIFQLNQLSCDWPELALIPFFNIEGSVSPTRKVDRASALAVPLGNDGHSSIGFSGGFHIDFYDTVQISFNGGATYFSAKNVNDYRLPTHETQSGVFPFSTAVRLKPGQNHQFEVILRAYRFIGKLSGFASFVVVNHAEDSIKILNEKVRNATVIIPNTQADPNAGESVPVFRVKQAECYTKFMSQFLTTAGSYEISPNVTLGFAVQWPIQQRNAFRSTTVIGTIRGTF